MSEEKGPKDFSFFEVAKTKINGFIGVRKFKSKNSGLTLILADVEGPVVTGHFVLATEAHDDDGLPHTLEHLIFLGSEDYPYKGVLDLLANRCLASGTNAWTDTDHTCYTMTTAGSEGFLELMPIYLEHILYPTLTNAGYLTEVHHITGEGEDAGVVYCEMQGRENTGESRANLELLRAAYPGSGYCAETGGIMRNLRTSTNNKKVRAYHAEFYRPENLTIIISGKVSPDKVFESLESIEEKILAKKAEKEEEDDEEKAFVRPWQTAVPPLEESKDIKVLYPSDEEDCGLVYVGYRGPHCVRDYRTITACNLLLRYLTDTSVSPLQKEFVEIDDPYASRVSHYVIENRESLLYFIFENVPIPKVDLVYCKLKVILDSFVKGIAKIDMSRLKSIIEREVLESFSNLESSPHDTAAFLIIGDVIYGEKDEDFQLRLDVKGQLEYFLEMKEEFWIKLLKKYLCDGKYVCVRAVPSIEEQNRMSKKELERIARQRNELGPEGLLQKDEEIQEAMEKNGEEPPEDMLTDVEIPTLNGIQFHHLQVFKSSEPENFKSYLKKVVNFAEFPTYTEVYDMHTNFIYMVVTLNTDVVPVEYRPFMLLYLELIMESPVNRGGVIIPYEEVVAALERDTIASGTRLGLETSSSFSIGPFSRTAVLMFQVDPKKYEIGVKWIRDLLHSTVFTTERVKVVASKMFNAVSQAKRKGNSVVRDLLKAMYYNSNSNIMCCSMLRQQKFLGEILEHLDDFKKGECIVERLNKIRKLLMQQKNITIHIAADLMKMGEIKQNLSKAWIDFVRSPVVTDFKDYKIPILPDWEIIEGLGVDRAFQGTIVGLGAVESAFLCQSAPGLTDFMSPDLPALMLYLQYLTQLEGPLWRQIRGQGFAYGYNIVPRTHEGMMALTLYRASNVVAAFRETKAILDKQLEEQVWDETLLESARSSLIFEIIERERSIGNLVVQSLLSSFKNVPADYNQILVQQVKEVTTKDLNLAGETYMKDLFSPISKTAIVCHPDKVEEIVDAFKKMDRQLVAVNSLDESILAPP